jgi:hypothetical protein
MRLTRKNRRRELVRLYTDSVDAYRSGVVASAVPHDKAMNPPMGYSKVQRLAFDRGLQDGNESEVRHSHDIPVDLWTAVLSQAFLDVALSRSSDLTYDESLYF